jgi:hypothetical protein
MVVTHPQKNTALAHMAGQGSCCDKAFAIDAIPAVCCLQEDWKFDENRENGALQPVVEFPNLGESTALQLPSEHVSTEEESSSIQYSMGRKLGQIARLNAQMSIALARRKCSLCEGIQDLVNGYENSVFK